MTDFSGPPPTWDQITTGPELLAGEALAAVSGVRHQNAATLRDKATQALTANADFLALDSPTNAQVLAQVRALTRETTALIRLLTEALDSTDGT